MAFIFIKMMSHDLLVQMAYLIVQAEPFTIHELIFTQNIALFLIGLNTPA